jgi:hypothetical protein
VGRATNNNSHVDNRDRRADVINKGKEKVVFEEKFSHFWPANNYLPPTKSPEIYRML